MSNQKGLPIEAGFTLIETILYLALFAIVIGGGMVATYQIIQASASNNAHIAISEEANFLLAKFQWVMSGSNSINANGSTLVLSKYFLGKSHQFIITASNGNLQLTQDSAPPIILNSSNVLVHTVSFVKTLGTNGKQDSITAGFTLTLSPIPPQHFSLLYYIPK